MEKNIIGNLENMKVTSSIDAMILHVKTLFRNIVSMRVKANITLIGLRIGYQIHIVMDVKRKKVVSSH